MKKIKSEKGAITLIVLVSMLFIVTFLISSYMVISNRAQSQKETAQQTKRLYESQNIVDIYNSYFGSQTIPIYTVAQLLKIGSGENIAINEVGGKIYTFSESANYVLMNDLEFDVDDWSSILGINTDWPPIGRLFKNNEEYSGNFEGNGHNITVTKLDNTIIGYNQLNGYNELKQLNIEDGSIRISSNGYTQNSINYKYSGEYIITGTTTTNNISIAGPGNFEITIKDLNIDVSAISYTAAFNANSNNTKTELNVMLVIEGYNKLVGGSAPGLGFGGATPNIEGVTNGSTLTIAGNGTLVAMGTNISPGIGGGYTGINSSAGDANNITINSGNIIAIAGVNSAGIGGALRKNVNNLIINGGTILAVGGYKQIETCGTIITAKGNRYGIGSPAGIANYIIINGGNITAIGGEYGGGIGGSTCKNILITGGVINASTNYGNPAIGDGNNNDANVCNVTIEGGTIIAYSKNNPAITTGTNENTQRSVQIKGGSVLLNGTIPMGYGTTQVIPINNGADVYLTTIKLANITSATKVLQITTSDNIVYGTKDIYTDETGNLYLYLPIGTRNITIQTSNKIYSGEVTTLESNAEITQLN